VGGNLDAPRDRVLEAVDRLDTLPQTRVEARSRLYLTQPMGPQDQPRFVNAVAGVISCLPPRELLEALLGVERLMGRQRQARWGPRIIDLDLIWMTGGPIREPGLELPHPGVSMRNFVLYPLFDIAPTLAIPGLGRVAELKARVSGEGIAVLEEPAG
jgi:2-amino-4-hydroxy-6-hydroxymethyldihydropteridine diphosphokinase